MSDLLSIQAVLNACFDADTNTLKTSGGGSGGGVDIGSILGQVFSSDVELGPGNTSVAQVYVAPDPTVHSDLIAHAPPAAGDTCPLIGVTPSGTFFVGISTAITTDLWDTMDLQGLVMIYDLTGANLLYATFVGDSLDSTSGSFQPDLSLVEINGTDLSITGGNTITSTAGGVYSVLLKLIVNWD